MEQEAVLSMEQESSSGIFLDDVSRLSKQEVGRVIVPLCEDDIFVGLEFAKSAGISVAGRGTIHSMGGQSLVNGGLVIDMSRINNVAFDQQSGICIAGAGATWADVIRILNNYGRAPKTLQSYASFSVGGSVSVNAHGITSDYSLGESLVSLKILRLDKDGKRESVIADRSSDLFRLMVGGYGLGGIISEVRMTTNLNKPVWLETIQLNQNSFTSVYEGVLAQSSVVMKLARIDITSFEHIALYVFRSDSEIGSVSDLPAEPRKMSIVSQLIYKWLAGPLMELRFQAERSLGRALDWSAVGTVNELLFESAEPLANLTSPLLAFDDTFLLQEFFVPSNQFLSFYLSLKQVILAFRANAADSKLATLLNCTIRFVKTDTISLLPYARVDSFAFVLYFRLRRTKEAEAVLAGIHNDLANAAIGLGGTFYLPYRRNYSQAQLRASYPSFDAFSNTVDKYNHNDLFTNEWWKWVRPSSSNRKKAIADKAVPLPKFDVLDFDLSSVSTHRTDSFRKLMSNGRMRKLFQDDFLTNTFSLMSSNVLMSSLQACCYDVRNRDDNDIYLALRSATLSGPVGKFLLLIRSIMMLSTQRYELVKEVQRCVEMLGLHGELHDMLNIGDHGKMVLCLRKYLHMKGAARVAHDVEASPSEVTHVLERCSVDPVATFERIDYSNLREREFPGVPDESVDLVTMMQGLHHLPPAQLPRFLKSVVRVLRPGGLFIVREHDLFDESFLPMLDCAHMVFNAVTGVDPLLERTEIRGFRSLLQWRRIITSFGMVDTMVYAKQPGDCTDDVMMCFRKPGELPAGRALQMSLIPDESPSAFQAFASALPKLAVSSFTGFVNSLTLLLPKIRLFITNSIKVFLPSMPGISSAISTQIEKAVDGYLAMLSRFDPLVEAAAPSKNDGPSFFPEELLLLIPVMRIRAKQGGVVEAVVIDIVDKISDAFSGNGSKSQPAAVNEPNTYVRLSEKAFDDEIEKLVTRLPELRDLETVIANVGVSEKAQDLLRAAATPEGLQKVRSLLLDHLDESTWKDLLDSFARVQSAPTLSMLLQDGHAWNSAAIAVMSIAELSWTQQVGLHSLGLSDVVSLFKASKEHRRKKLLESPVALSKEQQQKIDNALDELAEESTVSLKYTAKPLQDVENILSVTKAVLHAHSLTRLLSDTETNVTAEVAACLSRDGTLRLSELKLPATWRAGNHTLVLSFRRINSSQSVGSAQKLATLLDETKLYESSWRKDNELFTWLKLPEWMQQETIQIFGNTMETVPFYRFPFMAYLENYINVLSAESRLCASKFGWFKTLFSDAFITDLVGAIIMTLGFGALNLAAKPILAVTGTSYPKETLIERLLVLAPRNTAWPKCVQEAREISSNMFVLTIGTFKLFTPALIELSEMNIALLQISNNSVVQVRLSEPKESDRLFEFGTLATRFTYPSVGHINFDPQICLQVSVVKLLPLVRFCVSKRIHIHQIYDFFNYD